MGFDEACLKHHGMTRIDFLSEFERWLEKLEWERAYPYRLVKYNFLPIGIHIIF